MGLIERVSSGKTVRSLVVTIAGDWELLAGVDPARQSIYFYRDEMAAAGVMYIATSGDFPEVTGVPTGGSVLNPTRFTQQGDGNIVTLAWWGWGVAPVAVHVLEYTLTGKYAVPGCGKPSRPGSNIPANQPGGYIWTSNIDNPPSQQSPPMPNPAGIDMSSWLAAIQAMNQQLMSGNGDGDE